MRWLLAGFVLSSMAAQEPRAVALPQAQASRSYSPAVDAGDYVYISGQGPRRPDGSSPSTFSAQVRQALDNVKAIVESTGMTMEHVVYTQVYLSDPSDEGPLNRVWSHYFPQSPPARSTIGIVRLPGTPVEMNAVAVRDLSRKASHDRRQHAGRTHGPRAAHPDLQGAVTET